MGAHDFTTSARGKNAREAYRSACEDARSEYGNDPYNGTIATTNGVVELPAERFAGIPAKRRYEILHAIATGDTPKLRGKAKDVFDQLRRQYGEAEKWGSCYALRIRVGTYAFSGWAAS